MKFVRTPSSSVPAMEAARRYQLCSIRRICAFFASTALLVKRTKLGLGIDARSDMAAPQIIAATRTAIIKNIRVSENRVQAPDATMSMRKSIWCAKVSPSSRRYTGVVTDLSMRVSGSSVLVVVTLVIGCWRSRHIANTGVRRLQELRFVCDREPPPRLLPAVHACYEKADRDCR